MVWNVTPKALFVLCLCLDTSRSVTKWRVSRRQSRGSIQYHGATGAIVIARAGFYYVYSQMFYCDIDIPVMGHIITVNKKPYLKSLSSTHASDHQRKYNTNYNGALVRLSAGDTLSLKVIAKGVTYYMHRDSSFFGAFLVYPV